MNGVFVELTIIFILAGTIAVIVSFLKQPSIIAYIITGLIVGPFGYYKLHQGELLGGLAEIGITLLLFMVGLELDLKQLKRLGKTALTVGISQVIVTTLIGFGIAKLLGFQTTPSWFIALALTFSSTIIVVKLLGEKRDLQSLYGKLAVGIFLVQDFVALIVLILLSGASRNQPAYLAALPNWELVFLTFVKALLIGLIIAFHSKYVFPKALKYLGKSDELLLIFSLAWALGLATLLALPIIGFSLEIGGFLAGLALASSAVHFEIGARIKSLRDFFIIIFFIVLGSQLSLSAGAHMLTPAIILSLFVLIGNPIIVLILLSWYGYKPRTAMMTGITVGQISEFSLILMAAAFKSGEVSQSEVSLVTLIGIITIAASSYTILHAEKLSDFLYPVLKYFDFKKGKAEKNFHDLNLKNHIILVGAHRMGRHIALSLKKQQLPFVVVDHNPEITRELNDLDIPTICGDITDPHIQGVANVPGAKLIVSTIPNLHDNIALVSMIKTHNAKARIIVTADDEEEAIILYGKEIDYALLPHFIGGVHLAKILKDNNRYSSLKILKKEHLKVLGI